MAYKINGTTVVDNSRNVCACCVTSCCITASTRLDAPSGNTASRPSSPATGSLYFDTDEGSLISWNGSEWAAVGGGTAGVEITNIVTNACDAWGVMTIGACCCSREDLSGGTGCVCTWCCSPSFRPTSFYNSADASNQQCCHRSCHVSNGGYNYHVFSYYHGSSPNHCARITAADGTDLGSENSMISHYGCWIGLTNNAFAAGLLSPINNQNGARSQYAGGQTYVNCLSSKGNTIKPGIHVYSGRGEISFFGANENVSTKFCGSGGETSNTVEEFINTKGGVSRRKGQALANNCHLCTTCKCLSLEEAYGPHYVDASAWGPSPIIPGALCCLGGNALQHAIYTVTEDTYGNSAVELCDFAYIACQNFLSGMCCCHAGANRANVHNHKWNVGSKFLGNNNPRMNFSNLNTPCGYCERTNCFLCGTAKFTLVSKKVGFDTHDPTYYPCCIANSRCNGIDTYRTNHAGCCAWMVSFKSCPHCTTQSSYCSQPTSTQGVGCLRILSKDKCYLTYILNNKMSCCSCLKCQPYFSFCACSGTCMCCFCLLCIANEIVEINLVTGATTNHGYMKGACNIWMFPHCCGGVERCTLMIGGGTEPACVFQANALNSTSLSCTLSILPQALGTYVLGSDGIWSCNHCYLYIPFTTSGTCGVTWATWDQANKRYLCAYNFIQGLNQELSNNLTVKRTYAYNCANAADACFKAWVATLGSTYPYQCVNCCNMLATLGLSAYPTNSQVACCNLEGHIGNWSDNRCCFYLFGNGFQASNSYVNPTNDHLVAYVQLAQCQSSTCYRYFDGFVCYDLQNKCITSFHTLSPDIDARKDGSYNFHSPRDNMTGENMSSPFCNRAEMSGRLWATPDCSCMGYTFIKWKPGCRCDIATGNTTYYGSSFKTFKNATCCQSILGCCCLGKCVCADTAYHARMSVHRIPMNKPFECAGLGIDCDATKYLQAVMGHGPWGCCVHTCCTTFCTDCYCTARYRMFQNATGQTGGTTGTTDVSCCHKWCPCHSVIVLPALTTCMCFCANVCIGGSTSGVGRVCDECCFGDDLLTESCIYKNIKGSYLPGGSAMSNMLDPASVYSANPLDQTDLYTSSGAATVYPMVYSSGDTTPYNRICRYFKEKAACIC